MLYILGLKIPRRIALDQHWTLPKKKPQHYLCPLPPEMPPELLADQGYSRTKKGNLFNKHYSRWQLLNNLPPISSLWKRVKNPIITHSWGGRHQACSYWGKLITTQSQLFSKIISPKICLIAEVGTPQLLQSGHPQLTHHKVSCRLELGGFLGGPSW